MDNALYTVDTINHALPHTFKDP